MRHDVLVPTILFLASMVVWTSAEAQRSPLSPKQASILREVMATEGAPTKAQFESFWAECPCKQPEGRARYRKGAQDAFASMQKFQREMWLAARESSRRQMPIMTPGLRKLLDDYRMAAGNNERRHVQIDEMKESAEALIEAAATRFSATVDGEVVTLTPELIEETIGGIDAAMARINKLLAETWSP